MLHTDYFEVVTDRPRHCHRTGVARVAEYLQNEPAQDQVDDLHRSIRSLPTNPDPEAEQSVESHRPVEVTHAQRTVMRPEHTTILHQQQAARSLPARASCDASVTLLGDEDPPAGTRGGRSAACAGSKNPRKPGSYSGVSVRRAVSRSRRDCSSTSLAMGSAVAWLLRSKPTRSASDRSAGVKRPGESTAAPSSGATTTARSFRRRARQRALVGPIEPTGMHSAAETSAYDMVSPLTMDSRSSCWHRSGSCANARHTCSLRSWLS